MRLKYVLMCHAALRLTLFVVMFVALLPARAEDAASRLFGDYRQLVYQIRVIPLDGAYRPLGRFSNSSILELRP